ncbi:MAG: hypothetical protein V3U23_09460 [Kiloniellales bacterium]
MEPITAVILSALAAGAAAGVSEAGKKLVVDGYEALKAALQARFGADSDLADAVAGLEKHPESDGRKQTLHEEIVAANADADPELVVLARALLAQIESQPGGAQHIQNAVGSYIAQADRGGTATVTVTRKD